MSYDSINKILDRPLSFYDVQQCLNTSVKTAKLLCTHTNINKWSFYKPIIHSSLFTLTDAQIWSANSGLSVPKYTDLVYILNAKNASLGKWIYSTPIGGLISPYRLADFRWYNHLAHDWFTFSLQNSEAALGNGVTVHLPDLGTLLNFGEFNSIGENLRLGFIITTSNTSDNSSANYYPVTNSSFPTMADLESTVTLPSSLFTTACTYYIIPILSTCNYTVNQLVSIRESEGLMGDWYCFDSDKLTVNIAASQSQNVSAEINAITVLQQQDSSYTISELAINLVNDTANALSIEYTFSVNNEAGRSEYYLHGTINIAANSSATISCLEAGGGDKYYPDGFNTSAVSPILTANIAYGASSFTNEYDITQYII